jgi:hypothetical protein
MMESHANLRHTILSTVLGKSYLCRRTEVRVILTQSIGKKWLKHDV